MNYAELWVKTGKAVREREQRWGQAMFHSLPYELQDSILLLQRIGQVEADPYEIAGYGQLCVWADAHLILNGDNVVGVK